MVISVLGALVTSQFGVVLVQSSVQFGFVLVQSSPQSSVQLSAASVASVRWGTAGAVMLVLPQVYAQGMFLWEKCL